MILRILSGAIVALAVVLGLAVATADTPSPSPQLLVTGKAIFESSVGCHACHGVTGQGNGPVAFSIKPPPRNFVTEPFKGGDSVEQVFATITYGLPRTSMVGYPQVPEVHRWALAYYVLSFRRR